MVGSGGPRNYGIRICFRKRGERDTRVNATYGNAYAGNIAGSRCMDIGSLSGRSIRT